MKFTVFGGTGFIGRKLVHYLRQHGHQVYVPLRDEIPDDKKYLGHVIYTIGLTGNFRLQPYDTVEAHVSHLAKLLKVSTFDSWLYLSSTRIYSGLPYSVIATEHETIPMVASADSLYDLSKMLGESLCLTHQSKCVRVARLSNVFGRGQSKHTFLGSILEDLLTSDIIHINESAESCKDYVSIDDVIPLLVDITVRGNRRIYNVASGQLTTHAAITQKLTDIIGCKFFFNPSAQTRIFPQVDIKVVADEFNFSPSMVLDLLDPIVSNLKIDFKKGLS
jgi:nucleoside-diphosphate-sugar epimerase